MFLLIHLLAFIGFRLAGGDRDPAAAARGQSDVHSHGGEAEDGQDGGRPGAEVEGRIAVKPPKTCVRWKRWK